jgi:hypothetical protein
MACGGDRSPAAPSATPTPTPTVTVPSIPAGLSSILNQMLAALAAYITSVTAENTALLPNNPQSRTFIQAKLAALQNPSLHADIVNGQRWAEGSASSPLGPPVPIASVFMLDSMRAEAGDAVRVIESGVAPLEAFFNLRFPLSSVRIWYGFKLGNTGGGGQIYSEDRTTYLARTSGSLLPYDAILVHELSHSFVANEQLNQFLELYLYNVIKTGSTDPSTWQFTRGWVPAASANAGSAAVLDVYQLIGHDAMRNAYRAIYPLRPPYGSPLSSAVIAAFLSAVPPEHHPAVSAKLATITF